MRENTSTWDTLLLCNTDDRSPTRREPFSLSLSLSLSLMHNNGDESRSDGDFDVTVMTIPSVPPQHKENPLN